MTLLPLGPHDSGGESVKVTCTTVEGATKFEPQPTTLDFKLVAEVIAVA